LHSMKVWRRMPPRFERFFGIHLKMNRRGFLLRELFSVLLLRHIPQALEQKKMKKLQVSVNSLSDDFLLKMHQKLSLISRMLSLISRKLSLICRMLSHTISQSSYWILAVQPSSPPASPPIWQQRPLSVKISSDSRQYTTSGWHPTNKETQRKFPEKSIKSLPSPSSRSSTVLHSHYCLRNL
jgi:hypothetical protein